MEIKFDPESLTLGDRRKIAELSGSSIEQLGDDNLVGLPREKLLHAVLLVTAQKQDPSVTPEDIDNITMKELQVFMESAVEGVEGLEGVNPTQMTGPPSDNGENSNSNADNILTMN